MILAPSRVRVSVKQTLHELHETHGDLIRTRIVGSVFRGSPGDKGMDPVVIREVMLLRQPSKQFATTTQMGGTVLFLCSDAAEQITGTTISVDGGWTAL